VGPKGTTRWSTHLPVGDVEYEGIVEMSVESGWQPRPKKAWRPGDWQPSYHEPLLLSGDRLLASYFEMSSGIGCSYCLNALDGRLLWTTPLRPSSSLAIADEGEFLVGVQGYGAFDTYRYGRDGTVQPHWPSHAYLLVRENGKICGVVRPFLTVAVRPVFGFSFIAPDVQGPFRQNGPTGDLPMAFPLVGPKKNNTGLT